MAEIKAFRGLRYTDKAGKIGEVCCPPYDIISKKEREMFIEKNDCNVIRLELPNTDNIDGFEAYATARKYLNQWLDKEILRKDDKDGIYIYEMDFDVNGVKYSVKGYICLVKLEEFSKAIILPHEETLSKAKTDRFNLMTATGCNFSQIYSLYMDEDGKAFDVVEQASKGNADSVFTDADGVTHKLWCCYDKELQAQLIAQMADKKLYIADGHHRYETALNFRNFVAENKPADQLGTSQYVCMMLVNMENKGLVVFPTHRIVRDLENYSYEQVINGCKEYFDVTENLDRATAENKLAQMYSDGKKAFVMYKGNQCYTLLVLKDLATMETLMPICSKALKELDVSVLHTLVLERIFGIDKANMANQVNLTYTKIVDEAVEAVDSGKANCSFILNPTRVSEIRDVALAGEKMPQKSTYFYPKLTTGLVMNKIFD